VIEEASPATRFLLRNPGRDLLFDLLPNLGRRNPSGSLRKQLVFGAEPSQLASTDRTVVSMGRDYDRSILIKGASQKRF